MELKVAIAVEDDALAFLAALIEVSTLGSLEVLDVLEKPWKWEREWQLWHEHGKPRDPHDDDFGRFTEAVDRIAA